VRKSKVLQYAEDTIVWYSSPSTDEIENTLNKEMEWSGPTAKKTKFF